MSGTYNLFPGQPEQPPEVGNRRYLRTFRDVSELVGWNRHDFGHRESKASLASRRAGNSTWNGTKTYEEAEDLLVNGWDSAVKEIQPNIAAIGRSMDDYIPIPRPYNDTVGGAVDVGAYLQGIPEHMMNYERRETMTRSVHVVVNSAASAGVSADAIRARGNVVAALVASLDRLGVPVSLTVLAGVNANRGGWIAHSVKVKDEGVPLDMGRALFAIAHPAMLRRITFASWENEPMNIAKDFGFSPGYYGVPADVPADLQGDVYLAKAHLAERQWSTPDGATSWVIDKLRAMGVLSDG